MPWKPVCLGIVALWLCGCGNESADRVASGRYKYEFRDSEKVVSVIFQKGGEVFVVGENTVGTSDLRCASGDTVYMCNFRDGRMKGFTKFSYSRLVARLGSDQASLVTTNMVFGVLGIPCARNWRDLYFGKLMPLVVDERLLGQELYGGEKCSRYQIGSDEQSIKLFADSDGMLRHSKTRIKAEIKYLGEVTAEDSKLLERLHKEIRERPADQWEDWSEWLGGQAFDLDKP